MTTTPPPAYANRLTAAYLSQRAAAAAGGDPINFLTGTLILGDGNGSVPNISDLITADGVIHEVWRGAVVTAVTQNADNPAQFDIKTVIPAAISGVEVGPFWVREFAIIDENGVCLVVGTTNFEKTTSAEGQPSDAIFIVGIGESSGDVLIVSPGSSSFQTDVEVRNAINAHQPTAQAPLTQADTTVSGWLNRVFGLRAARQPSNVSGSVVLEADASGYGRPATDAEFAAGMSLGGFAWPWPTLQQIKNWIDNCVIYGVVAPLTKNDTTKKYGIANATQSAVGALRIATSSEVSTRTTNAAAGPSAVRPEDIPVPPNDPWGEAPGALVIIPCYADAGAQVGAFSSNLVGQTRTAAELIAGINFSSTVYTPAKSTGSLVEVGNTNGDTVQAQWYDPRTFTGVWKIVSLIMSSSGASFFIFKRIS